MRRTRLIDARNLATKYKLKTNKIDKKDSSFNITIKMMIGLFFSMLIVAIIALCAFYIITLL